MKISFPVMKAVDEKTFHFIPIDVSVLKFSAASVPGKRPRNLFNL